MTLLDLAQNVYDAYQQPLDLRDKNSWVLKLEEVSVRELVEVTCFSQLWLTDRMDCQYIDVGGRSWP
jgi:hypothetical protein